MRGETVHKALDCLKFTNKSVAPIIYKMIVSAMANATNKATVDVDNLVVSSIFVDDGPTQKKIPSEGPGPRNGCPKEKFSYYC